MIDLNKIKYDNMNQMSGLKEIFVLPFSKLITGSLNSRKHFFHDKRNVVHMKYKKGKGNEQSSISDHSNWHIHPLSLFFGLFLEEQKRRTTFLEG